MADLVVLIAEDNADTRALAQWLVESEGFRVIAAEDGAAALELLQHKQPDVIVTDIMMPKVDGLELIRRVRQTSALAEVPILAMSAYGDEYLADALAVGATATIRKPEGLVNIGQAISQVLAESRATA